MVTRDEVGAYKPYLWEQSVYTKGPMFREWILTKVVPTANFFFLYNVEKTLVKALIFLNMSENRVFLYLTSFLKISQL